MIRVIRMIRSLRRRFARAALLAISLVLLLPTLGVAHAVVFPKTSAAGAYERYVLRVPNEKTTATTRVEIRFPAELRVTSFADVPGWTIETVLDSAGRITGAVWTGTLAPKRFVELPFVAVNPKTAARLTWPVFQTYADGQRVEWTGPEGAKAPASATDVGGSATAPGTGGARTTLYVAIAALLLSLLSLGLALRRPEPATI
jgi:uncharacterized protein YcnI